MPGVYTDRLFAIDIAGNSHADITVPTAERWVIVDFLSINDAEATNSGDVTLNIAGKNGPNVRMVAGGPLMAEWQGRCVARGGELLRIYNACGNFVSVMVTGYRFSGP